MHAAIAHPGAEQVGRERRVAQLVDVRAGVRQTQRDAVVREQVPDRIGVVVGDVGAEARGEVLGDGDLAHHVERAACRARAASSLTRRPCSSGNRDDSDTSNVSQRGFIGDFSRSAAARARHSGIAVRGDARVAVRPAAARRTPCRC